MRRHLARTLIHLAWRIKPMSASAAAAEHINSDLASGHIKRTVKTFAGDFINGPITNGPNP